MSTTFWKACGQWLTLYTERKTARLAMNMATYHMGGCLRAMPRTGPFLTANSVDHAKQIWMEPVTYRDGGNSCTLLAASEFGTRIAQTGNRLTC